MDSNIPGELSLAELEQQVLEKEAREKAYLENELAGLQDNSQPREVYEEDDGFFNNSWEVLGSAVEQGAEQLVRTVGDLGQGLGNKLDPEGDGLFSGGVLNVVPENLVGDRGVNIPFTDKQFIPYLNASEVNELSLLYEIDTGKQVGNLSNFDLPDVDRPDSTLGNFSKDIVKFGIGFGALRKTLGAASTTTGKIAAGVTAGAGADFALFDPHEERLSDLLRHYGEGNPAFDNVVTEYLSADVTDEALEGRLKNVIEGAAIGGAVEVLFKSVKWLRARRTTRKAEENSQSASPVENIPEPKVEATPIKDADEVIIADDSVTPSVKPEVTPKEPEPGFVSVEASDLRAKLDVDPALRNQLAALLKEGKLSEAEGLLSFNSKAHEWDEISKVLEDGADGADVIRQIINTTSEVFSKNMDEAQGYQSLAKTLEKSSGATLSNLRHLHADVTGGKGIAARMAGARAVMTSSADRLRLLAKEAIKDGATAADEVALLRHVETHALIQAHIKGSGAEIARALHAMRTIKASTASDYKEFDKIVREIGGKNPDLRKALARKLAEVKDLNDIHKLVRKSGFRRTLDASVEVYINGLLSSLSTLTLNNTANAVKVIEGITERYFAVGIGGLRNGVRKAIGKAPLERASLREANAFVYGTMEGLRKALHIPLTEIIKDVGKAGRQSIEGDFKAAGLSLAKARAGISEASTFRAFIDESPQIDVMQRVDADTRKAISSAGEGLDAKAINLIGQVIRVPSRLILTSDELFKSIAYHQELGASAYKKAAAAADQLKLTGKKRTQFMSKEIELDRLDPSEDLHFESMDFARYQTFQSDLAPGGVAKGIEDVLNRQPLLKYVVPFYRTPVNIIKQTIGERTPLALAAIKTEHGRLWNAIAKGGAEGDRALARVATGSAFMGMGFQWAMEGTITGSGSTGDASYNTETLDNIPPYSIKLGDGEWYQYNRLEPFGMLMGLSADLAEAYNSWSPEEDDAVLWEASAVALTVITTNVTDKSWFKGVSDIVDAINSPKRKVKNYMETLGVNVITPYSSLVRRVNNEHDQYAREAWDFMDKFKKNIPGLSDELALKRDLLGNERLKQDYIGKAWISPFAKGIENKDPVYTELARLSFDYSMPTKDVFGVGKNVEPEVYSDFLRIRGTTPFGGMTMQQALKEFINSDLYRNGLSDGGRAQEIKQLIQRFTRDAKRKMINDNFTLQQEIVKAKTKARNELLTIPE